MKPTCTEWHRKWLRKQLNYSTSDWRICSATPLGGHFLVWNSDRYCRRINNNSYQYHRYQYQYVSKFLHNKSHISEYGIYCSIRQLFRFVLMFVGRLKSCYVTVFHIKFLFCAKSFMLIINILLGAAYNSKM